MVDNLEAALRLSEYADLFEERDLDYQSAAYRKASENVRTHDRSVRELAIEAVAEKLVAEIDGVGEVVGRRIAKDLIDN